MRVSLFDSVWAWLSVILCEFSAGKTEEKKKASLFKSWDEELQPTLNRKKYSPSVEEGNKIHIKGKQ